MGRPNEYGYPPDRERRGCDLTQKDRGETQELELDQEGSNWHDVIKCTWESAGPIISFGSHRHHVHIRHHRWGWSFVLPEQSWDVWHHGLILLYLILAQVQELQIYLEIYHYISGYIVGILHTVHCICWHWYNVAVTSMTTATTAVSLFYIALPKRYP